MKLSEMTLTEFVEILSSDAPAPGGGSVAALEGALGAALTCMVARLTVSKPRYGEYRLRMEEILREAGRLKKDLLELTDKDTEAFNRVSAALSMPKETAEEQNARKAAMQEALKASTETPLAAMRLISEALKLTRKAVGISNVSAASDLGVAALCLRSAAQGAWLNILINVGGIRDGDFAAAAKNEGEAILAEALPLADRIYEDIRKSL